MSSLFKSPIGVAAAAVGFLGFLGAIVAEVLTDHDPTATIAIVSAILTGSGLLGAKQVSIEKQQETIGKNVNGNMSALIAIAKEYQEAVKSGQLVPAPDAVETPASQAAIHEDTINRVSQSIAELPQHDGGLTDGDARP